nr:biliverdin-producing heme oxygenase [Oleiagrimonas sp. C23AA]
MRVATREAHQNAERTPPMQALSEGQLDRAGYHALLRAQWPIFLHFEQAARRWLDDDVPAAGWHYRSRLPALAADLGDRPDMAPLVPRLPTHDADACWGMLYVVEGSTLGARLLSRQLAALLGGHSDDFRFYTLGEDEPARWPAFRRVLDAQLTAPQQRARAIEGAHAMFAAFHYQFRHWQAHG